MGARKREAALVLCFLVLAGALAAVSEGFVPPVFGVSIVGLSRVGIISAPVAGDLLVEVTNTSVSSQYAIYGEQSLGLANATFTVLPSKVAPPTYGIFRTNATGKMAMKLAAGSYAVTFTNLPIRISELVKISAGATTAVQVSLSSGTYPGWFLDLQANQTGMVPAWTHAALAVAPNVVLLGTDQSFLDLYYYSGQYAQTEVATPLTVTNSTLRSIGTSSDLWIAFQPESSIQLRGLSSVEFSIYGASTAVTTIGGFVLGN